MGYAVVTGASGGIGEQMSTVLAAHGHDLVLVARREAQLEALADKLRTAYGVQVAVVPIDLTEDDACERLHAITREAGYTVDILVNNAGFGDWGAFLDRSLSRHENLLHLNVLTLMRLSHLYGRDMREAGGGRILNMASCAALCGGPYMSGYYSSKAWVLSFTLALAKELRGTHVSATALCPGPTATGFEGAAGMGASNLFTFMGAQSARAVAERGYKAMMAGKTVAYHSPVTHLLNIGSRILPRTTVARLAGMANGNPTDRKAR